MKFTDRKPKPSETDGDYWLEEQYWGHRLWDSQSPWLVFLEFLCVAEYSYRSGTFFDPEASHQPFSYHPYLRLHLRNIMFNGEAKLVEISERYPDSATAWGKWLEWITDNCVGLDPDERDFSYLVAKFPDFKSFALLIRALRSCALEGASNKGWGSRFVFPFGKSASYVDVSLSSGRAAAQYVYFGRSGELLYQMLARSASASELAKIVPEKLFRPNKWDDLVNLLQPPNTPEKTTKRGAEVSSFLPYDSHPIFDLIAEDWKNLLSLNLSGFDVIPYLATMGTFGLFLYQLSVSNHLLGREGLPPIICEAVAQRRTLVTAMSINCIDANTTLTVEALEAIFHSIENSDEWSVVDASASDQLARRRTILKNRFGWEKDTAYADSDELWTDFKGGALDRHARHFGKVHRSYGKGIGLISKRATNKLRYAPNDAFLKAIILANVKGRMEFGVFLEQIYQRYGLVFGETHANVVLQSKDIDIKPFRANTLRLEQRLGNLGLLRRLSDACAYIQNPFAQP